MNIQYHFKNVSDNTKDEIKRYADKRFETLEKYVSTFQEDNKMLHVDIEHQSHHNQFEIKTTLTLAGKQLHHVEVSHNWMEAVDKSEANLIHQTKKHIDHLRTTTDKERMHAEEVIEEGRGLNYDNI